MSADLLPPWGEALVAVLMLLGAAIALAGSLGLLRLASFFERVHAPAVIATLGCWCIVAASVLFFSLQDGRPALYPLLIALFTAITVPVTSIFLMRAALFRARRAGRPAPEPLAGEIRGDDEAS
ncbi:MAG: Na(+) H(+) antiporter subunit G [Burkholderiaceae bacterium]|jgi:multicomponent K+:H+ antiporter subunit G|nr:MAG: Na(+) H(+) antiporter subunit G [Burkholderiaceae bacterium]